jgi:hypothetical protein
MEKRVCRAMPDCGRSVIARGLCELHCRQELSGEPFRAVPRSLIHGSRMTGIMVGVSAETRAALGEHPHTQARLILEEWAKLNPVKK